MTVTDFLVTQMTLYPWMAWLLLVLAGAGLGYLAVWAYRVQAFAYAWLGHKRETWRYKTMVMRELREHPDGDDPPEYQHPDEDWTEPGETWVEELPPEEPMVGLAKVLERARELGLLEEDMDLRYCFNPDCALVGVMHNGPCDLEEPKYLAGAAMPPQPVREYLPPAVMDDLEAAGFSRHETTEGAVDSMFTRAQARVVEAMITDGIIPTGVEGKGQEDDSD